MSKPLADQHRARHRRLARHRRRAGAATRRSRRPCRGGRAHRRRPGRARRQDQGRRRHRHAGAARHEGPRRHRPARARAQRALRPPRRAGRQCRHARHAVAARPCRAEGLGRRLAVNVTANWQLIRTMDPLLAARGRPRGVPDLGLGAQWRAPIAGPTPSPRPRSKRWCAPTPPRLRATNVRANLFSPGQTRTRMMATAFSRHRSDDAADAGRRSPKRSCRCACRAAPKAASSTISARESFWISSAGLTTSVTAGPDRPFA